MFASTKIYSFECFARLFVNSDFHCFSHGLDSIWIFYLINMFSEKFEKKIIDNYLRTEANSEKY